MLSRSAALKARRRRPRSLVVVEHLAEESRRRELLAVADDDHLPGPGHRPEGIHRADLAGLVDEQEIECDPAGLEVLGDGDRAHHEHRLDRRDRCAGLLEELPDRLVPPLLGDLPTDDAHLAAGSRRGMASNGP